jgi:hypothetical protein
MVPCEYHLLRYLVDGDKTKWRKPLPEEWCCDMRRSLVEGGWVTLVRETFKPEDEHGIIADEVVTIWMFGRGEDAISVTCCPWCGAALK